MIGINVNSAHADYARMIVDREKTIETRESRSLDKFIGQRVAIVQTGKKGKAAAIGSAIIGSPVFADVAEFERLRPLHRVAPCSPYWPGNGGKWLYPLLNVEKWEKPIFEMGFGIVYREVIA